MLHQFGGSAPWCRGNSVPVKTQTLGYIPSSTYLGGIEPPHLLANFGCVAQAGFHPVVRLCFSDERVYEWKVAVNQACSLLSPLTLLERCDAVHDRGKHHVTPGGKDPWLPTIVVTGSIG